MVDPFTAGAAGAAGAAAGELAVTGGSQLVKSGLGRLTTSRDRSKGLKILKNLPKAPLEAVVFGEDDVTPELLAALSLGGTPGLQLSTIAQLKAGVPGDADGEGWLSAVGSPPQYKEVDMGGRIIRTRLNTLADYSLLNGDSHKFTLLDGQSFVADLQVQRDTSLSLDGNSLVVVVAFNVGLGKADAGMPDGPAGLVVRGEADGLYYCCENQWGFLEVASIDVPTPFDVDPSSIGSGSNMFKVCPKVLEDYSCFQRLCKILLEGHGHMVELIGLQKVVKELGKEFRTQIAGDGIPLLSRQHLRDVHNNLGEKPTLKMPADEELRTRVEEAIASLPLRDRDASLVLFPTMQKIISDFVKNLETEADRHGNVGVQPYKKKKSSNLIRSCIVQAAGMNASFAVFDSFRISKLNIAVSPGFTAVYFPGFPSSLTVAFPEGFEVQGRRLVLRPACPFTRDLQESLPILLGLAPKLANNVLKDFAETLSSELSKDPALALSPVTEAVVRVLSPGGIPRDALFLIDIFGYLEKHNPGHTWREASVAGILCQLGMTLHMPPRTEGCEVKDFRCFFQVCREVWEPSCHGAALVVDCGVDISGCEVYQQWLPGEPGERFFLGIPISDNKVTYEIAGVPWDKLDEVLDCKCFLLSYNHFPIEYGPVHIPVPCRVIGFGTPPEVPPEEPQEKKMCSIC